MAENGHEERKRRPYSKPILEKVTLASDEVSFAGCKTANTGFTDIKGINYRCWNNSCKFQNTS
jgi:hypothetical protein